MAIFKILSVLFVLGVSANAVVIDNVKISGNTISTLNTNGDLTFDVNGTGALIFTDQTASRVPYLDASKKLTSSSVTDTELGYLGGVTSALQTQLNAKAPLASPTFSGTIGTPLSASRVLVTDGSSNLSASSVTSTTLGFLDIGSSLTSLLSAKAPLASPTFTGTVTLPASTSLTTPVVDVMSLTEQSSTPSTPAAGTKKLYAKNDGKVYTLNSAGIETQVGAGAGSGDLNFITNPDAESDKSGWNVYADTAGTSPVDGTGETPTVTLTRNTSNPLDLPADFLFHKDAADRQGEGFSTDFDVRVADTEGVSRQIYVTADYITGSTFTQGDIKLFVRDLSGSNITPKCNLGDNTLPATSALPNRLTCVFDTVPNHKSYRFIGHIATTNATDWDVWFDNVKAEPTVGLPGLALTQQTARIDQTATLTGGSTLSSAFTSSSGSGVFSYSSGTYTMLREADVFMSFSLEGGTDVQASIKVNGNGVSYDYTNVNGTVASASWNGHLAAGDTFAFFNSGGQSSSSQHVSVVANAFTTNFMSSAALNAQTPDPINATSSIKTPGATNNYHALTNASVTTTSGVFDIKCAAYFGNNGSSPTYSATGTGIYGANGADNGTEPTTTIAGATAVEGARAGLLEYVEGSYSSRISRPSAQRFRCTAASCTFYCVTYTNQTTSSNARITAYANATKTPDFTVLGAYSNVNSGSTGNERVDRIQYGGATASTVCSSSPCTIYPSGTPIPGVSMTRSSTGQYAIIFPPGYHSGPANCWGTVANNANIVSLGLGSSLPITGTFYAGTQSMGPDTARDTYGLITCQGPR